MTSVKYVRAEGSIYNDEEATADQTFCEASVLIFELARREEAGVFNIPRLQSTKPQTI